MQLTCLAIFTAALAFGHHASASAPDAGGPRVPSVQKTTARSKIETYLAAHDVATAADLHAIETVPEKSLMAIALDPRAEGLTRARAVAALRLLPSPEVVEFLGKLVEKYAKATNAVDRLLVRRAAVALGWVPGAVNAPEQLARLFDNEDAEVRLDAAIGLGLTRAETAPDILRRQLAVETVARVRDQIERQLRTLAETVPAPAKAPADKKKPPMRSDW